MSSRCSISTSSLTTDTGDAKMTDARSAQARVKSAKRAMENWVGWRNGRGARQEGREPDREHF